MKLSQMLPHQHHKPLATFKELATEFCVTMAELRGYMRNHNAPKPELGTGRASYYDPAGMRKWWKVVRK